MRRLLLFLLFVGCILLGVTLTKAGRNRDVYRSICDLTAERFYKENEKLQNWVRLCRLQATQIPVFIRADRLVEQMQNLMNTLSVSHFSIYTPAEDRKMWKGESTDTGIRSRYVEELLIVYRVFQGSSAEKAGVKPGDVIVSLPGIEQVTPWGAERRSGIFKIKRGEQELDLTLAPSPLVIDASPTVTSLKNDTALLTISSFRAEFFDPKAWRQVVQQLQPYKHVIIDIRENAGGNFVAMLRALSSFECAERLIGRLVQPRKLGVEKAAFDDNVVDAHQLRELELYRSIGLRTFKDYGCYRGKVTVLISNETSSTAEIFADAMKFRPGSRVWGQPSAGDVVLAVWYDLATLGNGYSFSIPEAVFLNRQRHELEGEGVFPQKELFYDRGVSLSGRDSWIEESLRN
ncbi:MAG: hypothetical protein KF799_10320 [Bdellovibrionales bacterium]|nr:hypothetical protein [Bdellovibrionales bacterium]